MILGLVKAEVEVCAEVSHVLHLVSLLNDLCNGRQKLLELPLVLETDWIRASFVDELNDASESPSGVKERPNHQVVDDRACD